MQKLLKCRLAISIVFQPILGGILDTPGPAWDTVWRQGGRRGRHLEVILLSVFEAVFRDPQKATIATKWTIKVTIFHRKWWFSLERTHFYEFRAFLIKSGPGMDFTTFWIILRATFNTFCWHAGALAHARRHIGKPYETAVRTLRYRSVFIDFWAPGGKAKMEFAAGAQTLWRLQNNHF